MTQPEEANHLSDQEGTEPSGQAKCQANQEGAQLKAKKPYVKPSLRCEKVFETMALSCGKVQTTMGACHYNRKSS